MPKKRAKAPTVKQKGEKGKRVKGNTLTNRFAAKKRAHHKP